MSFYPQGPIKFYLYNITVTTGEPDSGLMTEKTQRLVNKSSQLYFQKMGLGTQVVNRRRQTKPKGQGSRGRVKPAGPPDTEVLRWTGNMRMKHGTIYVQYIGY